MSENNPRENKKCIAALLFSCPDRGGIIAVLANFFSSRGLNISRYEEYTDDGHSFSRLEWPLDERWENENSFAMEFTGLADKFNARFQVRFFDHTQSLGLLVSKQPHALLEILNKNEAQFFPALEISFIIGNDESISRIADRHATPFFYIPTGQKALEYEKQQLEIVQRYAPDYLGLARYKKILSANFIQRAGCPIVDIHHSFLPSLTGARPYQEAYDRGVKLIGAISHFVTAEPGQGPIIEQDVQRVEVGSSVQEMVKMGRDIEQKVFARTLLKVLEHKVIVHNQRTVIFN